MGIIINIQNENSFTIYLETRQIIIGIHLDLL